MEYMDHADPRMVTLSVKLLSQPGEDNATDRLNDHLARPVAATR